jgi:hypothetical protein
LILPPRDPTIRYLKKFDHPPVIKRGRELTTIDYNTGWVEYMSTYCDVHYTAGISNPLIELLRRKLSDVRLIEYNQQRETTLLGFIKNLVDIRREVPFTMPFFGSCLNAGTPFLNCGVSRFMATLLAGQDLKTTPCIWQLPKGETREILGTTTLVTSTLHAEELCNLEQVEYVLGFDYNNGKPIIINSILRDTVYDINTYGESTNAKFINAGEDIMKFWDRHRNSETNKVKITVACDTVSRRLVEFCPDNWDVTFIDLETPDFSFAHVLAGFADSVKPSLTLELRGATERFLLEYLVPLVDKTKVWFHTQDKKLNLIDTTKGPDSATWPIAVWGNLVK